MVISLLFSEESTQTFKQIPNDPSLPVAPEVNFNFDKLICAINTRVYISCNRNKICIWISEQETTRGCPIGSRR